MIEIRYGDYAVGAKEDFVPTSVNKTDFSNLEQLQKENIIFPNYGNPCELFQCPLDGKSQLIPSNNGIIPKNLNVGWWSNTITDGTGVFAERPILTLKAKGQYSSSGITLYFDTINNIYPVRILVRWLRDGQFLSQITFNPDKPVYYVENAVENYDEIDIAFAALNMPYNRLRMYGIDYGEGVTFFGNELQNCKIIQELNPISSEISINTCDFTLLSKRDKEYNFQRKQPLEIYFNDKLRAVSFVKSAKRKGKRVWEIQSEDYIGFLDTIPFYGDVYTNKNAVELFKEIFNTAKVPFEISTELNSEVVSGYIPYGTCREALMQVAFATGAVIDTSNSNVVNVYKLKDNVTQSIPAKRIMQGQNFIEDETVTAVEVTAHSYAKGIEEKTVYNAADDGVGNNIFVTFGEPLHSLSISNGTITKQGTNYAIINANNTSCVLTGKTFIHNTITKNKKNPLVLANEIEKVISITDGTLVSSANIDNVLNRCFEYLIKVNKTNLAIVEGKHDVGGYDQPVNVGEIITSDTEYLGEVTGRVIKETFTLNGGILVKEAEMV